MNDLQTQLLATAREGLSQSWRVPGSTERLSEKEIAYLKSLTIVDLIGGSAPVRRLGFFESLVVQVLTGLTTQMALDGLGLVSHSSSRKEPPRDPRRPALESSSSSDHASRSTAPSQQPKVVGPRPPGTEISSKHSTDPFLSGASETIEARGKGLLGDLAVRELRAGADSLGKDVPMDRAVHALGSGSSPSDVKAIYQDAKASLGEFGKTLETSFKAGFHTADFAAKVAEKGWDAAILDTGRDLVVGQFSKMSVEQLAKVVPILTPPGASAAVITILAEVFSPTDLAPSSMTDHPAPGPAPTRVTELMKIAPPVSGIPKLDPVQPGFRQRK